MAQFCRRRPNCYLKLTIGDLFLTKPLQTGAFSIEWRKASNRPIRNAQRVTNNYERFAFSCFLKGWADLLRFSVPRNISVGSVDRRLIICLHVNGSAACKDTVCHMHVGTHE